MIAKQTEVPMQGKSKGQTDRERKRNRACTPMAIVKTHFPRNGQQHLLVNTSTTGIENKPEQGKVPRNRDGGSSNNRQRTEEKSTKTEKGHGILSQSKGQIINMFGNFQKIFKLIHCHVLL